VPLILSVCQELSSAPKEFARNAHQVVSPVLEMPVIVQAVESNSLWIRTTTPVTADKDSTKTLMNNAFNVKTRIVRHVMIREFASVASTSLFSLRIL
jgi:hypothetical protein